MAVQGLATDPGPEELDALDYTKRCDVCQTAIPQRDWNNHVNGARHRNATAFVALKSALDESEKDKNGIVITGVNDDSDINFGLLEYGTGPVRSRKTITISSTNATAIDFVEARISSRQTSRASLS